MINMCFVSCSFDFLYRPIPDSDHDHDLSLSHTYTDLSGVSSKFVASQSICKCDSIPSIFFFLLSCSMESVCPPETKHCLSDTVLSTIQNYTVNKCKVN